MLTALTVKQDIPASRIEKLRLFYKKDPIAQSYHTNGSLWVKKVVYTNRRRRPVWKPLFHALHPAQVVLCEEQDWVLPENGPVKRFCDNALMAPLSVTAGITVLSRSCQSPKAVRVGIYDPKGQWTFLLKRLLFLASNLLVLTQATDKYAQVSARLLQEYGASVCCGSSHDFLCRCDLVLAPEPIKERLALRPDALVFTSAAPKVPLNAVVYDSYRIKLPEEFQVVKPEFLSDTYFATALFALCQQKKLLYLTPYAACSGKTQETIGKIAQKARLVHSRYA